MSPPWLAVSKTASKSRASSSSEPGAKRSGPQSAASAFKRRLPGPKQACGAGAAVGARSGDDGAAASAAAGRASLDAPPRDIFVAEYLPGELAARRASVVVSNGGSPTGYQALAEGRPVLGVAFNLDQYLATQAIERFGAGLLLRAGSLTRQDVVRALERLLGEPAFAARARAARADLARWNAEGRFRAFVDEVVDADAAPQLHGAQAVT
jgi:hypothetical protein